MSGAFLFDRQHLILLAQRHAAQFKQAAPFAHVVIDDFLPREVAHTLAVEFPPADRKGWVRWGPGPGAREAPSVNDKLGMSDEVDFPAALRGFALQLCSATFIRFMEELSGLQGLLADPFFTGCGLHSTGRGGRLLIHSDASRHPQGLPFHQAVNAILYVNEDWQEEYGGHLELWGRDAAGCVQSIAPVFNRLVVFETHSHSYHGHPRPLQCPQERRRNSIASYYYLVDREISADYQGHRVRPRWILGSR
jgi:hypothetical protein